MSNEIATHKNGMPSLAMNETELMAVLESSLYPGAKPESIKLVIGYCKASGLDPMQKPVHIVPMDVKNPEGKPVKRDVIMPGIGLYRTQAARTGLYAGVTEPEFGQVKSIPVKRKQWNNAHKDDKSFTMVDDGDVVEFPEWCRVTVKRLVGNVVVDFTAKEFWLENYAPSSKDTTAPNSMWKRRPYAQLAKCTEAQALRKAFPEFGSQPTADEMEGKPFDEAEVDEKPKIIMPQAKATKQDVQPSNTGNLPPDVIDGTSVVMAEAGEVAYINNKIAALKINTGDEVLEEAGLLSVDNLTKDGFLALRAALKGKKIMLQFDEANHEYRLGEAILPSVTQIIAPLCDFEGINQNVLEYASLRGKAVHKATELHDLGTLDESALDPVLVPYLEAWKLFLLFQNVEIISCEQRLHHKTHRYAGTFDRIANIHGEEWLLDIKAVAKLSTATGVQLAGYEAMMDKPYRRAAVQLKPDGTYRFQEYTSKSDLPVFLSCLTIFNWRKNNGQ